MAHTYKTEGIILKRWQHRERDKMVRVFTRDYGKLTARAISARKITSKLSGHLEPFLYADFFFAKSKTIDIVAGSSTLSTNVKLRESIDHAAAASFFAEVVDRFTQERQTDEFLFEFIVGVYDFLSTQENVNMLVVYAAVLQVLEHLGYRLELYTCHNCKRVVGENEQMKLHYHLWALECEQCRSVEDVGAISAATIKVLRFIQDGDFEAVSHVAVPEAVWQEVDTSVRTLLRYHVDGSLLSEKGVLEVLLSGNA